MLKRSLLMPGEKKCFCFSWTLFFISQNRCQGRDVCGSAKILPDERTAACFLRGWRLSKTTRSFNRDMDAVKNGTM